MCLIDNELMEGEEEFSWEEEHDELDEEYDRIQSSSQQRMKSLDDKIAEAERLLEKQEQEMNMAKELVIEKYLNSSSMKMCCFVLLIVLIYILF